MKFFLSSPATEWRPETAHGETVGYVAKARQAPERGERNVWRSIFCRPIRGLNIFWIFRPTVSPWAAFCRASGALAGIIVLFTDCAKAETTNGLSDAEIQGRQLAQQLLAERPAESLTNTGVLQIRKPQAKRAEIPIKCEVVVTATNWQSIYEITDVDSNRVALEVIHASDAPNVYYLTVYYRTEAKVADLLLFKTRILSGKELMIPFAGSDFWVADLGLEFFHWPEQKILKKEFRRNCSCAVLESANPNPSTNGYSRVVSWIDEESSGIVMAKAYDAQGRLLKEFYPKDIKKVKGQWQVESMEIRNVQTGSRTWLVFEVKAP